MRFTRPMARPVTLDELPELQRKRAEAIQRAGTCWLLHPKNAVQRRTPMPEPCKFFAGLLLFLLLGSLGNDCDGFCAPPDLANATDQQETSK